MQSNSFNQGQNGDSPILKDLAITGLMYESAKDAITAAAGGGQANAVALAAEINRVTTVATAADSVKLPPSAPGMTLRVYNDGANALAVFPSGTDTINDLAASASVSQIPDSMFTYVCSTSGKWECEEVGSGFSGQFPTVSYTNAITAKVGGGQSSATPLTTVINRVTTVTSAADSVTMPLAAPGMQLTVTNAAAANSMNLFPNTGDQINALGANAAFAIVAGKTAQLSCAVAGQWHAVLSA